MLVKSIKTIEKQDATRVAAQGLRALTNVDFVTDLICERHSLSTRFRQNAKSQAQSIRSCIEQAVEYRDAALASEYARPTLIYYSIMSFALCEILLKRDGTYRLDVLRQRHAHHGLDFSLSATADHRNLKADHLVARQLPRDTFAVWYETSRSRPLCGARNVKSGSVGSSGASVLALPDDTRPADFSSISLQALAEICPTIFYEASELNISTRLVRSTAKMAIDNDARTTQFDLIIHPSGQEALTSILEGINFSPRCADLVVPYEFANGGGFSITIPHNTQYSMFNLPDCFSINVEESLLKTSKPDLNEFAIYYLASYMCGMFARYYPEIWERCTTSRNQLFLLIDAMMSAAIDRAPILLLEEFRGHAFIFK